MLQDELTALSTHVVLMYKASVGKRQTLAVQQNKLCCPVDRF